MLIRVLDLVGEGCALEERLGGDAAPQHAGTAESLAFDDGRGEAELSAADGAYVPGGPAAEEDDVERGHGSEEWLRSELGRGDRHAPRFEVSPRRNLAGRGGDATCSERPHPRVREAGRPMTSSWTSGSCRAERCSIWGSRGPHGPRFLLRRI